MNDEIIRVALSNDNIDDIINAAKSVLFSLSDKYSGGFENYVGASLQDPNSNEFEPINQINETEFWNTFIIIFIEHKDYALESIHNHWVQIMENSGWGWNVNHNTNTKTCPLLIEYEKLTQQEQTVVRLFAGIVWALAVNDDETEEDDMLEQAA